MCPLINKSFTLDKISLGSASGDDEADFLPDFENYFYDYNENSIKVMEPNIFYLIGRKGSGKSLLARYIEKKFSDRQKHYNQFVEVQSFKEFKYQELIKFKDKDHTTREYYFIWKWCLLVTVAQQLVIDESATNGEAKIILKHFLENNFGTTLNKQKVINKSKNVKWHLGYKNFASWSRDEDNQIVEGSYLDYIDDLEEIIISFGSSTTSQFTIFLDGLDDGFERNDIYKQGICSLIYAIDAINRIFWRKNINAKFILLLRSDIFKILNTPDLNKFRMDNSLMLNWSPEEKENSPLFEMLIHKIITSLDIKIDKEKYNQVFYEIFEPSIENRKTSMWILDKTLMRPRDLVQMLSIAGKKFTKFNYYSSYVLKQTEGLYSDYLYEDIRNEMKGHESEEFIQNSLSLLKGIGKGSTVTLEKIKRKKPHLFENETRIEEVKKMLAFLYRFSVIGNIYHKEDNPSQVEIYSWSHREDAEPDFDATFTIHLGLRRALKTENVQHP